MSRREGDWGKGGTGMGEGVHERKIGEEGEDGSEESVVEECVEKGERRTVREWGVRRADGDTGKGGRGISAPTISKIP